MNQTEAKLFPRNPRFTYTHLAQGGISGEVLVGGMDTQRGFKVAIKQPHPQAAPEEAERHADNIVRETKALEILQGVPGVCTLLAHDAEPTPDMPGVYAYAYVVMTFAEGKPLEDWIKEYHQVGAEFPWLEVFLIFEKLTALLAEAHNRGVVHNDVDVKQIFWERETKTLTLIDWGNVVFFREEEREVRPQDDIYQVGEALYKVITQMDVSSAGTSETLLWGTANPPPGLRAVVTRALNKRGLSNGESQTDSSSFADMATLHAEIERLRDGMQREAEQRQEAMREEARRQLAEYRKQAGDPQISVGDLEILKQTVAAWPAREILPDQTETTLRSIDAKILRLKAQAEWQIARTYLKSQAFDQANSILQNLVQNQAEIDGVDLPLVAKLCNEFTKETSPRATALFDALLDKGPRMALEVWMVEYHEAVKKYRKATDRAPALTKEVAYILAQSSDTYPVRVCLEWLETQTEYEVERMFRDKERKGRLKILSQISADITELLNTEFYHGAAVELSPEREYEIYQKATESLQGIETALNQVGSRALQEEAHRLREGAIKITTLLGPARHARRDKAVALQELQKQLESACMQDISNPDLGELRERVREAASLLAQKEELDRRMPPRSGGWNEFEPLYESYKTLRLGKATYLATLQKQWQDFERHYNHYTGQNEGSGIPQSLVDSAYGFPPLYHLLRDIRERDNRRYVREPFAPQPTAVTPTPEQRGGNQPVGSPSTQSSSPGAGQPRANEFTGRPQATSQPPQSQSPEVGASSGLEYVEELICKQRLIEADKHLRELGEGAFHSKKEREAYQEWKNALEEWSWGVHYFLAGQYQEVETRFSRWLKTHDRWKNYESSRPQKIFYDHIDGYYRDLNSKVLAPWRRQQSNRDPNPWEQMRTILFDILKLLAEHHLSTDEIDAQIRLHRTLQTAATNKQREDFQKARSEFEKQYAKHMFLAQYREIENALSADSRPAVTTLPAQVKDSSRRIVLENISVVFAILLLIGLALFLVLKTLDLSDPEKPTVTPTPVATATRAPTRVAEAEIAQSCRTIAEAFTSSTWESVLQEAETASKEYGDNLSTQLESGGSDCANFKTQVEQSGKTLVQSQYNEGHFAEAITTAQNTLDILEKLNTDEGLYAGDERKIFILQQCASYSLFKDSNTVGASAAMEDLRLYLEEPGFNSDFESLCKIGAYSEAISALTPTPDPGTCTPTLPNLVKPDDDERVSVWRTTLFTWEGGQLCEGQFWLVTFDVEATPCKPTTSTSVLCLAPVNAREWRVEIRDADNIKVLETETRDIKQRH